MAHSLPLNSALNSTSKEAFLDLLLASNALKFGSFQTKSGRNSPYFFNTGSFDSGLILSQVAKSYVELMDRLNLQRPLHLFGPAYKGISLATACAQEWARLSGEDVAFTFNRKEQKNHGEGGSFIGREINSRSRLIIVEDVMTGGTSVRECLAMLKPTGAQIQAVVVGVDREERGTDSRLARQQIEEDFKIPVYSILGLSEIIEMLWNKPRRGVVWVNDEIKAKADEYRKQYGVS